MVGRLVDLIRKDGRPTELSVLGGPTLTPNVAPFKSPSAPLEIGAQGLENPHFAIS